MCVAQLPLSSYAVQDPTQGMVTAIVGGVTAPEVVGPGRMELLNEADCSLMQWSTSLRAAANLSSESSESSHGYSSLGFKLCTIMKTNGMWQKHVSHRVKHLTG